MCEFAAIYILDSHVAVDGVSKSELRIVICIEH